MAKWNPFGVEVNITAVAAVITRTSATQYKVKINASWVCTSSGNKTDYGMTASSGGGSVSLNEQGNKANNGSGSFTGTYSISGNGGATKKITVTFRNFNDWHDDSKTSTVELSVDVPAWTSYAVTYNANGGSGAPVKQTKWKDQDLTLSSAKPTRAGYTFKGWNTKADGSGTNYAAGANYTKNEALPLYAVWEAIKYSVKFDKNTGDAVSNMPDEQTKIYGAALTISDKVPTRTNYTFKGWGVSESATTVSYAAGANYTNNAAITLYAIWELSYTKPRINNLKIDRCDSSGNWQDDGADIRIEFGYELDKAETPKASLRWKVSTAAEWVPGLSLNDNNADRYIAVGTYQSSTYKGTIDPEKTYTWELTVSDSVGSTTLIGTVSSLKLAIDVRPPDSMAEGDDAEFGVSVGKTAEKRGVFDMGLKAKFSSGYISEVLTANNGAGVDLDEITAPGWYVGANQAASFYSNTPPGLSGTFTLEVMNAGVDGEGNYVQLMQRITRCSTDPLEYVRHYFSGAWQTWVRKFGVSLYSSSDGGSTGTISLKDYNEEGELVDADLSKFKCIEIYYTDNNGKTGGYTKVRSPNGKSIDLSIIEPSTANQIYIRRTRYTASKTALTPETATAGYIAILNSGIGSSSSGTNYLKIVKVLGYEYEF